MFTASAGPRGTVQSHLAVEPLRGQPVSGWARRDERVEMLHTSLQDRGWSHQLHHYVIEMGRFVHVQRAVG